MGILNGEFRCQMNGEVFLRQAARLNLTFHILRPNGLLKDISDDWGTRDLYKLLKQIQMY
jgi:hypothetical protein